MPYRQGLRETLEKSDSNFFNKKTIDGINRSILEAILEEDVEASVLMMLKNEEGFESLVKRIDFNEKIRFHDLTYIRNANFTDLEFTLISSPRFGVLFLWNANEVRLSGKSKIVLLFNSSQIDEIFEFLKTFLDVKAIDDFELYRPDRRSNFVMNKVIAKITNFLNENVQENVFIEQEQQKSLKKIKESESSDDFFELFRDFGHEIKNQISICDIYVRILEKTLGADDKNLQMIKKSNEKIIKEFYEFQSENKYNFKRENITELLDNIVEIYADVARASTNKIKFNAFIDKCYANIDENKFATVVNNILKNANESTKNDTIDVNLDVVDGVIKIDFINHGEKIDEADKNKIFEKGFSTKTDGWGVGLAVCKRFIEHHCGELLLLKSDENETIFEIKLPLA